MAVVIDLHARRMEPAFVAGEANAPTMLPQPIGHTVAVPPSRMKILVANKFFFVKGGAEVVMLDEIELLKRYQLEIVEFSMQDPRNLPSKYESYFVSNKSYRSGSRVQKAKAALSFVHSWEAVRNVTRLIRDVKPDIFHCHNIYHQLTPSIISAAARLKTPVVLTLHDYKPVCPVYLQVRNGQPCTECSAGSFEPLLRHRCADGSLAHSALLWAEARFHAAMGSYDHVDKFIAPSRFMRDQVVRRFGEDKVVHIPNCIDSNRFEVSGEDENYVLFLGRLSPEKGVETLLRAHAADNAAWRLVIAGSGPLMDDLRSRYPLAEFIGQVSGDRLKSTLRGASLIVLPSECHENCPMSVLEAMAYAKPVVASRIGGIPELVRHGATGFLFKPKDSSELSSYVKTLLGDSDMRARFGQEARRIVEAEYSIERHGAALLSLYESLVSARGQGGSQECI